MQANQRRTPFSLEGDYTPIRRTTQELPATIEIPKIKSLLRRYNEWLRAGSDFVEVIDTLVGALHFWYDEVQSYLGEHNLEHLRPHIDMFFAIGAFRTFKFRDFVDRDRLRWVYSISFVGRFQAANATPVVSGRLRIGNTNVAIPLWLMSVRTSILRM